MGSIGNQTPWPPYKDCSEGTCSISCPQRCYFTFLPPLPSPSKATDDGSASDISPLLVISIIGILASALILAGYYTLISKRCRRRNQVDPTLELNEIHNQTRQGAQPGLDESTIRSMAMYKYKKGEGLIEGTDCSVCLSEFQENEVLRLLPKCDHAFHLPCIDPWLKSHASCPLCRSNVAHVYIDLLPQTTTTSETPSQEALPSVHVSTLDQYQRMVNSESVIVIQILEEGISNLGIGDAIPKSPSVHDPEYGRSDLPARLGSSSCC